MTELSASRPPLIVRPVGDDQQDLLHDLAALSTDGTPPPLRASCTRPAILRRIAACAADAVPADADRIASRIDDEILAAAVSLHTGVPFVAVGGGEFAGDLHPGERVVVVGYVLDAAVRALVFELEERGLRHDGTVAVYGGIPRPGETVLVPRPAATATERDGATDER